MNSVGVDATVESTISRCTAAGYVWNPYFIQLAAPLNVLFLYYSVYFFFVRIFDDTVSVSRLELLSDFIRVFSKDIVLQYLSSVYVRKTDIHVIFMLYNQGTYPLQ